MLFLFYFLNMVFILEMYLFSLPGIVTYMFSARTLFAISKYAFPDKLKGALGL